MTWTEASGTYWMAVLIMGVLGYIKQKELLWRNADQRRRVYTRNPTLPCDYLGAFRGTCCRCLAPQCRCLPVKFCTAP